MLRPALTLLLAATAMAQSPPLLPHMKTLAESMLGLEAGLSAQRRPDPTVLASLTAATRHLREMTTDREFEAAGVWIDQIEGALVNLAAPDGNLATDRFDIARVRGACTSCHLLLRGSNEERGLFPSLGSGLFGTIELMDLDGKPLADREGVVVFLEGNIEKAPPLPRKPTIRQKGRRFEPPVLVVTAGTIVRFPNDDVVFHNVFSKSTSNPFDLGLYGKGGEKEQRLDNPGLVRVHCQIHADMVANVLVLDNHFAAITLPSGFWAIPDLPDGDYTLRVWHPFADVPSQSVQCRDGMPLRVAISVRENKPRVQHTNKFGRAYRTKY